MEVDQQDQDSNGVEEARQEKLIQEALEKERLNFDCYCQLDTCPNEGGELKECISNISCFECKRVFHRGIKCRVLFNNHTGILNVIHVI